MHVKEHPAFAGSSADQASPERVGDSRGAVADTELLVDVLEVRPHRGGTDDELFGDPGTAQPLGREAEHLELALG